MPLYEYQCVSCGHRFEVIKKYSDAPPAGCPKCNGTVEKLVSSPAIQFKGSGFYLTDYGRGGKSDTAPGQNAKSESGDKGEKADKEKGDKEKGDKEKGAKAEGSGTKDAAPASASSGDTSSAKTSESKPAAPATPKSD